MIFACLKFADSNLIAMAKSSFKLSCPLEARMGEATRMREKYPDRIPDTCSLIICFLNSNFDILLLGSKRDSEDDSDDDRYLVPSDLTVGQFKYVVRKRIKLGAEIAVFVNNTSMPPTAALMSAIYEKHKDERWATLTFSLLKISHHGCSIDTSRYVTQSLNLNITRKHVLNLSTIVFLQRVCMFQDSISLCPN
ncbi:unnamed protein product [Brassica rapa subsp. trilocularis]